VRTDGAGYFLVSNREAGPLGPPGSTYPITISSPGYDDVERPAVLVEVAGYTEANFAMGTWLPGDYDVDGDVDLDDYGRFAGCITGPENGGPAAGCDLFDFDTDNDVDHQDFGVFQAGFTG
jgi:hypothetical protein